MNENDRSHRYPNFKDVILFFGAFFLVNLMVAGLALLLSKFGILGVSSTNEAYLGDVSMSVCYTLSFVIMILLTLLYRRGRLKGEIVTEQHKLFKKFSLYHLLWGIILIVAVNMVLEPFINLFPDNLVKMYETMSSLGDVMVLTSVFVAPIVEETLFRGILQNDFQKKYNVTLAVIFTSLIFGIVHLNFIQGISAFFTSLVLGFIYYQTRSLWAVIFLHFFNNASAQILFRLYPDMDSYLRSTKDMIGIDSVYWSIYGASCAVLIFAIFRIVAISKQSVANVEDNPTEEDNNNEKNADDESNDNYLSDDGYKIEDKDNNLVDVDVKLKDNKI